MSTYPWFTESKATLVGGSREPHRPMTARRPGPSGSFVYTVASEAWWWSDGVYRLHGFGPGDVVPTTELVEAHRHPDEDGELVERILERHLAPGECFSVWHRILDARRRSRQVVTVGEGTHDQDGGLREVRGYMVDVTGAHRAETGREVDEAVRRSAETRATIEQAKGALMVVLHVPAHQAFEVLRRRSQHANVKLRELAQQVVSAVEGAGGADPRRLVAGLVGAEPQGDAAAS